MTHSKIILFGSALICSASVFAQDSTQTGNTQAYGDNPNLAKVLAVKAQESIQNTANQVGDATERGIAKIKPSVNSAWQNTKEFTTEKAIVARDATRQGIDTTVKSVKSAKQNIIGTSGVPIERGSLSHPDENTINIQAAAPVQQTTAQAIPIQESSVILEAEQQPTIVANTQTPSQTIQNQASEIEPVIQRQSVAIPNSAAPASTDSDAGIPR